MLMECPVCHQPQSWVCALRPAWSQWTCRQCGSLLGISLLRRLLAAAIFIPVVVLTLRFTMAARSLYALGLVIVILGWIPLAMLIERPRVIARGGFRCRGCGYDLRGQVTPRCPECGRELDEAERELLATGAIPSWPARRPERWRRVALLMLILVGLLVAGLFVATPRTPRRVVLPATQTAPAQANP